MTLVPTTTALKTSAISLWFIASLLILQQVFVYLISEQYIYETNLANAPIVAFVFSQIAAGLVFLGLLPILPRLTASTNIIILAILTGLILRVLNFDTTPIMELDFYRYLWDGAITASGINPYAFSPEAIQQTTDPRLQNLAEDAGHILTRINYADLRTIYPPLTQLFFALSFWVDQWNLDAWRFVLLVSELVTLSLIFLILKKLNYSPLWMLLYWWNPLVIHETYNTVHMDVLLLPFLLAALFFMLKQKSLIAACCLTLAAGIKLWPLLLLPFALRPLLTRPRKLITALVSISVITLFLIVPLLLLGLGENSGLAGYSKGWVRNSAIFPILVELLGQHGEIMSRLIIAGSLTSLVLYFNWQPINNPQELIRKFCWVIVVLFLFSPTQFPWYSIWFAPLLCFYPRPALLLLSALMPIYYLRFYFLTLDKVELFDSTVIWLQYLPIFTLLALDRFRQQSPAIAVSSRV